MKKVYVSPQLDVVQMHCAQLLAASLSTDITIGDGDASVGGEGDDALTDHRGGWQSSEWE